MIRLYLFALIIGFGWLGNTSFAGVPVQLQWRGSASGAAVGRGVVKPLGHLSAQFVIGMKQETRREVDPRTSRVAKWRGIRLADVVERAIANLSPELKAQVDLIVLKNGQGEKLAVPRAFVTRYPVLLAIDEADRSEFCMIVPWTSKPSTKREALPLEKFFFHKIRSMEFTSYQQQYRDFILARRTDPSAILGEKLFVQTCASCHGGGTAPQMGEIPSIFRGRAQINHPPGRGYPQLSSKERRAVKHYFKAYWFERAQQASRSPR